MDIWGMVEAERRDLADLAATLTDEQWDAPSLCAEWKVRDVVGHVNAVAMTGALAAIKGVVTNRFNVDRYLARDGITQGARPRAELVADLRAHAASRALPPMIKPHDLFGDVLVHGQDVRRPLGLARDIEPDHVRLVLDREKGNRMLGVAKRVAGLRLVATDLDWSHGDGPEVRGTGEAILMAILGRATALADLDGAGVPTLAGRLGR